MWIPQSRLHLSVIEFVKAHMSNEFIPIVLTISLSKCATEHFTTPAAIQQTEQNEKQTYQLPDACSHQETIFVTHLDRVSLNKCNSQEAKTTKHIVRSTSKPTKNALPSPL